MSLSCGVGSNPLHQRISYQKEVADLLLTNLERICPETLLAGGAPRDWELGHDAQDLDIYTSLDRNLSTEAKAHVIRSVLEKVGDLLFLNIMRPQEHSDYSAMEGLDCVLNGYFRGQQFQIINMETQEDLAKAVERFDTSICKIWYKGGQTHYTDEFTETIATRVIKLSEGYAWRDKHPIKMFHRFHGLGFTFEGFTPSELRPILPGVRDELVFELLRPWEDTF